MYLESSSITRNKSIAIPKSDKTISIKNSYINAIMILNSLPNEYKTLNSKKSFTKKNLKNLKN